MREKTRSNIVGEKLWNGCDEGLVFQVSYPFGVINKAARYMSVECSGKFGIKIKI